jgi:5-(carboxyamino)imidazole ribonucleotide mutase
MLKASRFAVRFTTMRRTVACGAFATGKGAYNAALPDLPASDTRKGSMPTKAPLAGIIMGSQSDWPTLKAAADVLKELGVAHECRIISAHRTPDRMADYAKGAARRGIKVIIAGAGGAAHLPGMTASMTTLPVLGVPVESKALKGMDSLLSIVQMPGGVPVATFAIGEAGAKNAGLHAAAILSLSDPALAKRLAAWRKKLTDAVAEKPSDK